MTAGQTVLVFSGTYSESVTVTSSGTASAPINFVAAPGATVTVTGSGSGSANGFYLNNRSYVTVQGFNVTGTSADGIVVKNSSNITIRGSHVSYSGQPPRESSPRESASTAQPIPLCPTTRSTTTPTTASTS